jgi:hypothetical protein
MIYKCEDYLALLGCGILVPVDFGLPVWSWIYLLIPFLRMFETGRKIEARGRTTRRSMGDGGVFFRGSFGCPVSAPVDQSGQSTAGQGSLDQRSKYFLPSVSIVSVLVLSYCVFCVIVIVSASSVKGFVGMMTDL